MKGELLKRLFRAIASNDHNAIDKLTYLVIEDERKKGHTLLANQLENITQKSTKNGSVVENGSLSSKSCKNGNGVATTSGIEALSVLPTNTRLNTPLVTFIPREKLRHHMILPSKVEKRFSRIEKEYAARDRLAHHGLRYRQKILLFGIPGCGKTMGAERLAWNTGLSLLKVRFDAMVSSYLGETATNLRLVFELANKNPCLLFFDLTFRTSKCNT